MKCLFDTIIENVPAPDVDENAPLQLQPALLDYNDYVGRIGIGRIKKGKITSNQMVACARLDGSVKQFRIQKLFGYIGLKRIEIEEASAGDIVAFSGLPDIFVGETVCEIGNVNPLPTLHVDEPTLQMTFGTNTSPFAGKDGKLLTARKIEERLYKETQKDVSLRVERIPNSESWVVSGRGELHLSILIENMRREGFELQVSKPEVVIKEIDGVQCEPYEELQLEVPDDCVGGVMEALGPRGAQLENMTTHENQTRLLYCIPTRGLIGFSTAYLTLTKGYGIINHTFREYRPFTPGNYGERLIGVLVATETGQSTAYSIEAVQERGTMFIEPGIQVYEGMIVGENAYNSDLAVNVVKEKHQTNTRASGKDHSAVLKRPHIFSLETALDYLNSDELLEVTPHHFRLRKKILDTQERKKYDYRVKNGYQ